MDNYALPEVLEKLNTKTRKHKKAVDDQGMGITLSRLEAAPTKWLAMGAAVTPSARLATVIPDLIQCR